MSVSCICHEPIERLRYEDGAVLEAHVFDPGAEDQPRAAIVVFHGGGWVAGDSTWSCPPLVATWVAA